MSTRWRNLSQMIAGCVLHHPKIFFIKRIETFFIWNAHCHLTVRLHLMDASCLLLAEKEAAANKGGGVQRFKITVINPTSHMT